MKRIGLFILIAWMGTQSTLRAQKTISRFRLSMGVVQPLGDFSKTGDIYDAMAGTGYGGFLDFSLPVNNSGFLWINSIGFFCNSLSTDDLKDEITESWDESDMDMSKLSISSSAWKNIPIMTGIQYHTFLSNNNIFYLQGQMGINFSYGPEFTIKESIVMTVSDDYYPVLLNADISYADSRSVCFSGGAGLILNHRFDVGIRYFNMGKIEYDVTEDIILKLDDYTLSETAKGEMKHTVSLLLITFGFNF